MRLARGTGTHRPFELQAFQCPFYGTGTAVFEAFAFKYDDGEDLRVAEYVRTDLSVDHIPKPSASDWPTGLSKSDNCNSIHGGQCDFHAKAQNSCNCFQLDVKTAPYLMDVDLYLDSTDTSDGLCASKGDGSETKLLSCGDILFSKETYKQLCDKCGMSNCDCANKLETPTAPKGWHEATGPRDVCRRANIPITVAQRKCGHLNHDLTMFGDCVEDYCGFDEGVKGAGDEGVKEAEENAEEEAEEEKEAQKEPPRNFGVTAKRAKAGELYFTTDVGETCPHTAVITDYDECKDAFQAVGYPPAGATFSWSDYKMGEDDDLPPGCSTEVSPPALQYRLHLNMEEKPQRKAPREDVQAICKTLVTTMTTTSTTSTSTTSTTKTTTTKTTATTTTETETTTTSTSTTKTTTTKTTTTRTIPLTTPCVEPPLKDQQTTTREVPMERPWPVAKPPPPVDGEPLPQQPEIPEESEYYYVEEPVEKPEEPVAPPQGSQEPGAPPQGSQANCHDDNAAVEATFGQHGIKTCAEAKAAGACQRFPEQGEKFCPITCELGCGKGGGGGGQAPGGPPQGGPSPAGSGTGAGGKEAGAGEQYYYEPEKSPEFNPAHAFLLVQQDRVCGTPGLNMGVVSKAEECAIKAEQANDEGAPAGGWRAFALGKVNGDHPGECNLMKLYPVDIASDAEYKQLFETWSTAKLEERSCPLPGGWTDDRNWDFFAIGKKRLTPMEQAAQAAQAGNKDRAEELGAASMLFSR